MTYEPGCHIMPSERYHADPCPVPSLSRSVIQSLIFKTPARVYYDSERLNPAFIKEDADPKFDIGTAAHALLLEGPEGIQIIDAGDYRSGKAKEDRAAAREAGKTPLLTHQYIEVSAMVEAAKKQIAACPELKVKDLRKDGKSEQTYIWQDGDIWLRTRLDWISNDSKLIMDYKTTDKTADPNAFKPEALGYDIQDALYSEGVEKVSGVKPQFVFVVQETYAPYFCSFIALPPQFREMGQQKVTYGKFLWDKCLKSGVWPAYPNQICYVDPSPYALAAWENRAANIS